MYPAVQGLIIASAIQTIGYRMVSGKFEKMHVWTFAITLVFGGLTLILRNAEFIQWKASIIVWFFAGFFLFRQYISKKPVVKELMDNVSEQPFEAPESVWKVINLVWPIGFTLFGILNLYVAYNFSEAFWVNFKLFGMFAMNIVLLIFTIVKLFPYFPEEEEDATTADKKAESATSNALDGKD